MLVSAEIAQTLGALTVWIGFSISSFGICTNVLNIIIFARQGLQDRTSTSLLALAVSDLGSMLTQAWSTLCYTPSFVSLDLPFMPQETQYLIAGWPRLVFTRVTTWITAYMSLEKCLCVVTPLKVKNLFTRRRTIIFIVVLYLIMCASMAPVYYTTRFSWLMSEDSNKTLLGVTFAENRNDFEICSFYINNIMPTIAFFAITACTVVLITELKRRVQWRKSSTISAQADTLSNRDAKLVKMVASISILFILCYTPGTVLFVWMLQDSDLRIDGEERYLFLLFHSCLYIVEAINASITLFIYLSMSSKFWQVFVETFSILKKYSNNTNQTKKLISTNG